MARELYGNNLQTTLNGAINNSTTSVVITSATGWPTGGFRIMIDSEIMYCTSRSGTTLTVVRGSEGTTAVSHITLSTVRSILTAAALDNYRAEILAMCGIAPNDDSLSADDDNFDDESFSGWTTVQTTPNATITEKFHSASIKIPTGQSAAQHTAFVKAKTPSVAGQYVQAGFRCLGLGTQYPIFGVIMADGNTYGAGKQVTWQWSPHENAFIFRSLNNYSSDPGGATTYNGVADTFPMSAMHFRLAWESSNTYSGYVSADGITWAQAFASSSRHTLGTVTHMGFFCTSWGATREAMFGATYCRFSF